jgi:hypothetical protein
MNQEEDNDDYDVYDCKTKKWVKEIPKMIDYSLYEIKELLDNHVNVKTQDFSNIIESVRVCARNYRINKVNIYKTKFGNKINHKI